MNEVQKIDVAGLSSPASFAKRVLIIAAIVALAILSLVIFGVLFGVPGIIVAAPLMIVVMILVQKLYVEGILGDEA